MKFTIERERLLKPLQQVIGPLSGRPRLPILGNILFQVVEDKLYLTSTDLEVELVVNITLFLPCEIGATAVPAHKFFNICRGLPEKSEITVKLKNNHIIINSGRSRFLLSTLLANDFPKLDYGNSNIEFNLSQDKIKYLIEATQFSMAYQDVRFYLNGMLFETEEKKLNTVATDGHRLAICSVSTDIFLPKCSVIVPRKGVIGLIRILNNIDSLLLIKISINNIRFHIGNFIFTSKLIEGNFPDYRRVLSKKQDKIIEANCDTLKQAFARVAILSNEKSRGVRLCIKQNQIKIIASNIEQEKAEEVVDVIYNSTEIEISFNVNYLLDILNTLKCRKIHISLTDSNSSIQIKDVISENSVYVVMPLRS